MGHFAKDCRRSRDHKCGKKSHMGRLDYQRRKSSLPHGSFRSVLSLQASRMKDGTLAAVQVVVVETHEQNPVVDEEEEIHSNNVTGDTSTENRVSMQ